MRCKGELKSLRPNWKTNHPEVTLEIDANIEDIENLKGKPLTVEIKQYKKKRSREANNYHYALCSEIARCLGLSVSNVHNRLLRECGYIETIGGQSIRIPLPDTDKVEEQVIEAETYHLKPTSQVIEGNDGICYRTYILLRGSHDYNTAEMSHLIDMTIDMAKEQGIETMTNDQISEMMAVYEQSKK